MVIIKYLDNVVYDADSNKCLNGVVYVIRTTNNETNKTSLYVGSTVDFNKRKGDHSRAIYNEIGVEYNSKKYKTIRENGNWNMEVYKNIRFEHRRKLDFEEERIREELDADLNSISCYRTKAEKAECNRVRNQKNKVKIAEKGKVYNIKNKVKIAEKKKVYRTNNKDKLAEKGKVYYTENREEILEQRNKYYANNKEKLLEQQRIYNANNKEKLVEYRKDYYAKNKKIISEKSKVRYINNKEKKKKEIF